MANTQIAISKNGKTTLATAGKYCERNIDINVAVASAGDDLPSYVKAEADSIVSKIVSAQGNNVFTLAAITDLHYGNGSYTDGILHASQALAYINKQITLDAFTVLGDYTDGYPADNVDNAFGDCRKVNSLLASMENIPNLRIQGNHDFYSGYSQFVHYHIQAYSEGVTWGDKNGGYFYRDFADKKLRIICVNTTETDNANITVSTTQYTWFVNALDLSAKSDSAKWQILVLSHHPLDWYVSDSYRFAYILEAYKNGTSGTVGNVSYNFAGKNSATLIGNIHGHIHNLLTGYLNKGNVNTSNPTNILRICTPEACINRANQYSGSWAEANTYNKTTNSAKDTSFVVYCIDLNTQNIKAFCYGAGYDREISYAPVAPTVYNIANILTNCTASGADTIVEEGTASIVVSAKSGYKLPDTITVSGASYTWDQSTGTIMLSNPTNDVTVTVVAVEINLPYTNQIWKSINSDGTPYNNGQGWKTGYRINSNGVEAALADWEVTGFIPVDGKNDVLYFKNIQWQASTPGNDYVGLYDENFTKLTSTKILSEWAVSTVNPVDLAQRGVIIDENNNITSIDFKKWSTGGFGSMTLAGWSNVRYIRFSMYSITDDSIITKNQPIDTPTDTEPDVEPTTYTNQIPLSINSDKTPFVGTNGEQGYKTNTRLGSSGTESAQDGMEVTGFIPVVAGDTLYFKNVEIINGGTNADKCYFTAYDSSFSKIANWRADGSPDGNAFKFDTNNNILSATFVNGSKWSARIDSVAYFRVSATEINSSSIITKNEPIDILPDQDEPINKTYTVTNNLTNVITNNSEDTAVQGASYNATLTPNGESITSVTVTMGGVDVTSSVYSNGVISISSVSGDIVITAVSEVNVEVVNLLDTAGYTDNTRFSASSGSEKTDTGCVATGYIDVHDIGWDDKYYAWGAEFNDDNAVGKCVWVSYDSSKTVTGYGYMKSGQKLNGLNCSFDAQNRLVIARHGETIPYYIRLSGVGSGASVVVTKNQL